METFSFGTQTAEEDFPPAPEETNSVEEKEEEQPDEKENEDEKDKEEEERERASAPPPVMSPEEKENVVASDDFSNFFVKASKRVERLLGAPVLAELLMDADYSRHRDDDGGANDDDKDGAPKNPVVAARADFCAGRWTDDRDVTDVDWSPVHRELIVASYNECRASTTNAVLSSKSRSSSASSSPVKAPSSAASVPRPGENRTDGLVLVWSLAMADRPEHVLTSDAAVNRTKFHPTENHLVVGATQDGRLNVWDLRVGGRLPVQRSTLSTVTNKGQGHSHPICALDLADGGSGLVTASTDGRVNFWSLANLRDPAESLNVPNTNITALAVAPETNSLLVGDERGALTAVLPQNAASAGGRSAGASSRRSLRRVSETAHFGTVTGVATRASPRTASKGASVRRGFLGGAPGLALTCGVDWTTRLWAPGVSDAPVLELVDPAYDYVADVGWSPTRASLFASATARGTIGLWNLADQLDEPLTKGGGVRVGARGANRLRWSADGRRIATASSDGVVVVSLTEEVSKGRSDDETRMMGNLVSRGFLEEEE